MNERGNIPPLHASSRLLSIYWWLLALAPPINFAFAMVPSLSAGGVIVIPLLIATLLLAPIVAVRAFASPALDPKRKVICVGLSVSAFPMFLLVQAIWALLATPERIPSASFKVGIGVTTAAWVLLAVLARIGLTQDHRNGGRPTQE